jgi:hypothetical protein
MTRLTATRKRQGQRVTALSRTQRLPKSVPLPIPTGGLDAVSPRTAMPPDSAIILDNWFPQLRYIELRRGHAVHCDTDEAEPVETLMAYNAPSAVDDRLFAAANGKIMNVSTATESDDVVGLTNDRWQWVNFATSGGNFLICVNGADTPRRYNGTNWATLTITGATSAELVDVASFKFRLWFALENSLDAYFLPPDFIQGALTRFPLGGTMKKGGALAAIATWSLDGGDGPDDLIAFISTKGEVAVYNGTDPTNARAWNLVGVYEIGAPIGRRCWYKVGGDVAIISIDGVIPLSKAMVIERGAALSISISAKIQPLLNIDARSSKDNFGWQLIGYPLGTRAILNVPQLENETQIQYVMNTVSGSWCRFLGMNANCWVLWKERIFFGGNDGVVYEADTGADDNGEPIEAEVQGAFTDGGSPLQKLFGMARPFIVSDGDVRPAIGINVDYREGGELSVSDAVIVPAAQWDEALWDVDMWPIEERLLQSWQELGSVTGNVVSIRLKVSASAQGTGDITLQLIAFQITYTEGAII